MTTKSIGTMMADEQARESILTYLFSVFANIKLVFM